MSNYVKITVLLPRSLHRRLKVALAKHGTNGQAALLPAIEESVKKLEESDPPEAIAS